MCFGVRTLRCCGGVLFENPVSFNGTAMKIEQLHSHEDHRHLCETVPSNSFDESTKGKVTKQQAKNNFVWL